MINSIIAFFKKLFSIFSSSNNFNTPNKSVNTHSQIKTAVPQSSESRLDASKASTKITYSDTLIPNLKDEHQALIQLYGQIGQDISSRQYVKIRDSLATLKHEFNRHIMQENVSFYCYLEQQFANDENHLETIKFYRKEMNGISHAFVKFIKKWQTTPIVDDNIDEFKSEYDAIGEVLAQRINSEEDHLYTLYQPS